MYIRDNIYIKIDINIYNRYNSSPVNRHRGYFGYGPIVVYKQHIDHCSMSGACDLPMDTPQFPFSYFKPKYWQPVGVVTSIS